MDERLLVETAIDYIQNLFQNSRISHNVAPSYGRPEQDHLAHCILGKNGQPESPGMLSQCLHMRSASLANFQQYFRRLC